ncbi:MAG: MarR family winged helix-turn-helix transcriptional regulator [Myxococcales bacterium]
MREVEADLGPVVEFMRHLWAVEYALQTVSKRMESHLGISGQQRLIVLVLGRTAQISPGALARILHIHPSTLTFNLQALEDGGIIAREFDRYDARRALLSLTPRGRNIYRRKKGTVENAVRRVLGEFPEDARAAQKVLARLAVVLEGQ